MAQKKVLMKFININDSDVSDLDSSLYQNNSDSLGSSMAEPLVRGSIKVDGED